LHVFIFHLLARLIIKLYIFDLPTFLKPIDRSKFPHRNGSCFQDFEIYQPCIRTEGYIAIAHLIEFFWKKLGFDKGTT